jgi:hypothetical protein
VHFVFSAVETIEPPTLRVNERPSGSKQYPLRMMPTLLVYCYANDVLARGVLNEQPISA